MTRATGVLAPADPGREEQELREYLGDGYQHDRLQRYEEQLQREFAGCGDEAAFYRSSEGYLYNLCAFAMTGTKEPYLADLVRLAGPPPARILDYGCGIGSDGLRLLEAGYEVSFADFTNPSTRYLAWRLERRGLRAPVYDLDRDEVPAGFQAAYSFDVIEHVEDPWAFLAALEARSALVMVNLLGPDAEEDNTLHRDLPVDAIVRRARERGLCHYRVYHGRSHLVAYRPTAGGRGGLAGRGRAWAAWAGGRARALLPSGS